VRVNRVVTGLSGSAGSLQALRFAAEMARDNQAELVPILAWTPPGGEYADRRCPNATLRAIWRDAAQARLDEAVNLGLGGPPMDVEFSPHAVRGPAGEVLTWIAREAGDVLVIGAGRHGPGRILQSSTARYCLAHASCPVTAVPPSELAAHAHSLGSWLSRHRMSANDAELHATSA
jgi:nucleotide-binding universal stress UspA family protein